MTKSWRATVLGDRHRALGSKLEDLNGMPTAWTYASDLDVDHTAIRARAGPMDVPGLKKGIRERNVLTFARAIAGRPAHWGEPAPVRVVVMGWIWKRRRWRLGFPADYATGRIAGAGRFADCAQADD